MGIPSDQLNQDSDHLDSQSPSAGKSAISLLQSACMNTEGVTEKGDYKWAVNFWNLLQHFYTYR